MGRKFSDFYLPDVRTCHSGLRRLRWMFSKVRKAEIKIAGGTAHIPVMKAEAEQIMTLNPDIQISIAAAAPAWASSRSAKDS